MSALPDIESDMSRFHRIDDIRSLTPSRFFMLANRLFHYGGAVTHAMQRIAADAGTAPAAPASAAPSLPAPAGATVVPSTPAALALSDLGPLLSFGTG